MKTRMRLAVLVLLVAGQATVATAQGPSRKYGDMLKRLPEHANALMLVDVDGLFASALGRRERWRENAGNRPTGVLGVSGDASKFVVAASIDLQTAQERWKLGMIQTHAAPPPLSTLAAREGGYVEQLQTQNVAWTPRDFYLMSFPENVLGFAVPADRQLMADWLRSTLIKPRTFPPGWADKAIFRADAGVPIVLALNLANTVSPKGAAQWLKTVNTDEVKRNEINFQMLGSSLAGVKFAFLQIEVTETIRATVQIEFDNSLSFLKPVARDVVFAALEDYGTNVDDLRKWSFDVGNNTITMSGALTEDSVRRVLTLISAPRLSGSYPSAGSVPPIDVAGSQAQPAGPAREPSKNDALAATQKYFHAVVDIIQSLKSQNPQSTRTSRVWYDRAAKEIENLPLLLVDNDLLDWGAKTAITLREMSSGINYAAKDKTYRIAGTPNGFYGGYGYSGNGKAYDAEVINKQYNSVLSVQVDVRWQALESSIADTRRKLVAKYQVEF